MIAEAYSSPASEKYHESDVRKLFLGLSEIGGMFGLTITKPKKLDEGVAKQIKIDTIKHDTESEVEETIQSNAQEALSKNQPSINTSIEDSKEDKNNAKVEVNVSTIDNETTPEKLKSIPISG